MLGEDLLVAPIFEYGKSQRNVYLPQGNWVHVWSKQVTASLGANYQF